MDDKERYTAWLEIQEKYRLREIEWRENRRGKHGKTQNETQQVNIDPTKNNIPATGIDAASSDYS